MHPIRNVPLEQDQIWHYTTLTSCTMLHSRSSHAQINLTSSGIATPPGIPAGRIFFVPYDPHSGTATPTTAEATEEPASSATETDTDHHTTAAVGGVVRGRGAETSAEPASDSPVGKAEAAASSGAERESSGRDAESRGLSQTPASSSAPSPSATDDKGSSGRGFAVPRPVALPAHTGASHDSFVSAEDAHHHHHHHRGGIHSGSVYETPPVHIAGSSLGPQSQAPSSAKLGGGGGGENVNNNIFLPAITDEEGGKRTTGTGSGQGAAVATGTGRTRKTSGGGLSEGRSAEDEALLSEVLKECVAMHSVTRSEEEGGLPVLSVRQPWRRTYSVAW